MTRLMIDFLHFDQYISQNLESAWKKLHIQNQINSQMHHLDRLVNQEQIHSVTNQQIQPMGI